MSRTVDKKINKLLPIEEKSLSNIQKFKINEANEGLKKGLPIICCTCGAEILVVPDLKAMNRAFKTHVTEHRNTKRAAKKSLTKPNKIITLLSQLTLIKMSQQNKYSI